jgi:class 3 adenylate cyclase/CheY-like chemotaxis protein
VLVVDDDPLNRELLATALKNEGCDVTTAEDGLRALRILRSSDSAAFDLLLLDVLMPGMDGYDVLRHLKAETALAHMPVIVVSAVDDISSAVKCLELGAEDYLTKPFDPVLLRARINSSLTRKRQADTERLYLRLLEQEEERADRLILNVLPRPIAERLKRGDTVIADHFDDVTVMFADLVGFTSLAAERPASDVVALLDDVFTRFDRLTISHGLEKIKTIGDAYLAVGGLTNSTGGDLVATVEMAFEMLDTVATFDGAMELRIGIHAGPVVAGVIGTHKFSYDLWGDTVNIAARMESHGVAGRIQVSEVVRDRLSGQFSFDDRGPIEVRNRGTMKTYFVRRPPSQLERKSAVDLVDDNWPSRQELVRRR